MGWSLSAFKTTTGESTLSDWISLGVIFYKFRLKQAFVEKECDADGRSRWELEFCNDIACSLKCPVDLCNGTGVCQEPF